MTIGWKTIKLFKVKKCQKNAKKTQHFYTQKIKILKVADPFNLEIN